MVLGLDLAGVEVPGVGLLVLLAPGLELVVLYLGLAIFELGLVVVAEEFPSVVLLWLLLVLVVCRLGLVKLIPGLRLVEVVEVEPVLEVVL